MRIPFTPSRVLLLGALAVALTGCMQSRGAAASMPGMADGAFSDPEVLEAFIVSNQGEVITSRPVVDAAGVPADVRAFAQQMIDAHSRVIQQAEALDMTPAPNEHATTLQNSAESIARDLDGLSGDELAMMYVMSQVVLHDNTLRALEHTLIPSTRDAELRALLQQTVPAVRQHLERAKALHHQMVRG